MADTNLINYSTWTEGTGNAVGFTRNGDVSENVRFLAENPWGQSEIVWEARPLGQVGSADGGWDGSLFPIDRTKTYRFSVWVNRTVRGANGQFYLGTRSYDGGYKNLATRSSGSQTNNPYFWVSSSPWQYNLNEWYLIVGHVWPVGSGTGANHPNSGIYTRALGRTANISNDFVWLPDSVNTAHRSYLYYSPDTTTRQRWIRPRVDLIDGTEPTIQDLLSGFPLIDKHIGSGSIAFTGAANHNVSLDMRYWVSTTARNWNDPQGWATTSGGTPGAIPPAATTSAVLNRGNGDCTLTGDVAISTLTTTSQYTGRLNLAGFDLQADTATLRHSRLNELNGTLSVIDSTIVSNSDPGRVKITPDETQAITGYGNVVQVGSITLEFFVPSIILEIDTEGQLRLTDDCFIPGQMEIGAIDLDGHNLTVADDLVIRPDTSIDDWGTINVLGEWVPITEAASIAFASGESDAYPVYCPLADGGIEFDGESIHIPTYCPASDGSIEFDGAATATVRRVASRMRASIRTFPAFAGRVARY